MSFWLFFVGISFLFLAVDGCISENLRKYSRLAFVSWLIFISGFRYMIGWDYQSYMEYYTKLGVLTELLEPAMLFLIDTLNALDFSYQALFLLHSVLTVFFIYRGCRYYTEKTAIPLVMFALLPMFYWNSLSIIRQALAVSIFFWGSQYIIKRSWGKFLCVIAITATIHYSSVFCLSAYYLMRSEWKRKWYFVLVVSSAVFSALGLAESMMVVLVDVLNSPVFELYMSMFESAVASGLKELAMTSIGLLILFSCWGRREDPKVRGVINMCVFSLAIGNFLSFSGPLARLALYFQIFYIVGIGYMLDDVASLKYRIAAKMAMFLFAGAFMLYTIFNIANNPDALSHHFKSAGNIQYEFNFNLFK